MYRIRGKTTDGKTIAGPASDGCESLADAVAEAEKAAETAGKELKIVSVKYVEGAGNGIRLTEPRKGGKSGKGKKSRTVRSG